MRLWSGTLLAFLTWLLIVPEAAVAECRSHDRPTIPLATGQGIRLETLDLAGDPAVADVTETPRRPKPCTGAMCSSRPAVPLSPAPSQVLRVGLWAILEIATMIASPDRTDTHPDDGQGRPTRSATPIFHPPRLAPSHLAS